MRLHDYQLVAVEHLQANPHAALFLAMGLGKTAITLSALTPDHLPALVVAPKRVAERVWSAETSKWRSDLTISVAAGSPARRRAALDAGSDITVIGRDNLADAIGGPWRTLILDELSGFKTRGTSRWKAARKIAPTCTYRWGLTGTPAPNGIMNLWAQLALLDGGQRLGTSLTGFRSRYFIPGRQIAGGVVIEWVQREETEERVYALLDDICLSMRAVEGLVPPVTFNTVEVDIPATSRVVYDDLVRDLIADLGLLGELTVANLAVLSNKLSQVTAGFSYLEDGSPVPLHTEKLNALAEIVEGNEGSPVLCFYRYKAEAAAIRAAFPEARGVDEPDALDAWDRGEVPLLLAHPASAGHGLNLQRGGHTAVWTSLSWDLELWQQANARLARQGQQHPVVIHVIEARSTVDGIIRARLDGKAFTQDALLDALLG